jgi:hypothetical protein
LHNDWKKRRRGEKQEICDEVLVNARRVHVELPAEERGEAKALLEESTAPIAMASIQSKWV